MLKDKQALKNNPPAGFDGMFDWDYINPAFQQATGRNIELMDHDGTVEINGQHIIFETKNKGEPFSPGPRQALEDLWHKGDFFIVILWGKVTPIRAEFLYPGGQKKRGPVDVTAISIREEVYRWACWAERNPAESFVPKEIVTKVGLRRRRRLQEIDAAYNIEWY